MNKALLPHFLIVGAPKCGTTALHFYLSQHPEINTAEKEVHFFGEDLNYRFEKPTLEFYQSNFKETGLNGDSSVWYLYSDSIFEELKALGIQPKIIILLRNPTDFAYSLHSQNIADANEDVLDFKKALDLEESRKRGVSLPKNVDPVRSIFYKDAGNFYPRVKKFQDNFGKENVFVELQEHLKSNPVKTLKKIELFLGIEEFNQYDFTPQNENKTVKNAKVNHLIKKSGNFKKTVFRTLIPIKSVRKRIVDKFYFSNFTVEKRLPLTPELKSELQNHFSAGVSQLNSIIDHDISHWNK